MRKKPAEKKEWSVMIPITKIIRFFKKKPKKTSPKDAVDKAISDFNKENNGGF